MCPLERLAVLPSLALIVIGGGCDTSLAPGSFAGRISISEPTANEMMLLPDNNRVLVTFDTNYMLMSPGECSGEAACGSVHLLLDGTACNISRTGYNALATFSPSTVDLALCTMAIGRHTITADLYDDAGALVEDPITKDAVSTSVPFTVQK